MNYKMPFKFKFNLCVWMLSMLWVIILSKSLLHEAPGLELAQHHATFLRILHSYVCVYLINNPEPVQYVILYMHWLYPLI